jgi:hypothetical protein
MKEIIVIPVKIDGVVYFFSYAIPDPSNSRLTCFTQKIQHHD